MNPTLKHLSSLSNTMDKLLLKPELERDQGDLKKSLYQNENSEWLWVSTSGKMIEIDNNGRPLQMDLTDKK